jgi:hypothetical protein
MAVAVALSAAAALAACSATPAGTGKPASPIGSGKAPPPVSALAVPSRTVPVPRCSTAVAAARTLSAVHPVMTVTPHGPFGVVTSADGRWIFVGDAGGVTVLRAGTAGAAPILRWTVPIPGGQGLGEALTPNGRYLLVAATSDTAAPGRPGSRRPGSTSGPFRPGWRRSARRSPLTAAGCT